MSRPKHSETEFQSTMLPNNRKEVFRDILRLHVRSLLMIGVMLFLFSLPMQIGHYLKDLTIASIYSEYSAGRISAVDAQTSLISISNTFSLINVVLLVFFGIGISGIIRIVKRLAWYEPVTFMYDFYRGIIENGLQIILLFLIVGILSFVSTWLNNLSSFTSIDSLYSYLGAIPGLVLSIIFLPVVAYLLIVIAIYRNSFRSQIRLSLYLYFSAIVKSLKHLVLLSIPFLILVIPNFYVGVVGRIVLMFVLPLLLLRWFLLSSDLLDSKWNSVHYPELVNKGVLGASLEHNNE